MSDKYYKVERWKCHECGKEWATPGAAESCYKKHELQELTENVDNHPDLAMSEVIEHLKEIADEGEFDYERST